MVNNLAHVRARESAADDWLASRDDGDAASDRLRREGFIEGAEWGYGQGDARYRPAYEELSGHLAWLQSSRSLTAIYPGALGLNLARAASDLIAAAYPDLRPDIGRDGAGVRSPLADLESAQDEATIERAEGQRQLDQAAALMREASELLRGYEAHHLAKAEAHNDRSRACRDAYDAAAESRLRDEALGKANRNALMAHRLEAWLSGEPLPGSMDAADQAAQEAFVSAALDAGVDQISEADEPPPRVRQRDLLAEVIGRPVHKSGGDYQFEGEIRAIIPKRSGALRYAVEDDRGLLLIMNASQCGLDHREEFMGAHARHRPDGVADLTAFRLTTPDPRFDPAKPVCVNGYLYRPTKED